MAKNYDITASNTVRPVTYLLLRMSGSFLPVPYADHDKSNKLGNSFQTPDFKMF